MLERGKKSAIVTTSSGLRLIPCPGAVTYSSSKAFASWFTMALNYELKLTKKHVDVLNWDCGRTQTNMTGGQGMLTADKAVGSMLKHLGRTSSTSGHAKHEVSMFTRKHYPEWLSTKIFFKLLSSRN